MIGLAKERKALGAACTDRVAVAACIALVAATACKPDMRVPLDRREGAITVSEGARLLHVLAGARGDRLGVALAAIGDVDGDKRGELVIGAARDASSASRGPGFVRVVSLASGRTLHEARGRDPTGADRFGERLAVVGDVDGDRVYDFAVGAWRAEEDRGALEVRSGRDGHLLARVDGMPPWEAFLGSAPSAAGDVDGDGSPDVAVSVNRSRTFVFSAKDGRKIADIAGTPLSLTGDLDGDGKHGLLLFDGPPRDVALQWTSDVRTARVVSIASGETRLALDAGADLARLEAHGSAGDLDRDGFMDWIIAGRPADTGESDLVPGPRERRVRVLSGKTGGVLASFSVELAERGRMHLASGVGDLDGDGVGEMLVAWHHEEGHARGTLPLAVVEIHAFPSGRLTHSFTSSNWSFGTSAAALPDQDGDGRAELVLGEPEASYEERSTGRVYVISIGKRSP